MDNFKKNILNKRFPFGKNWKNFVHSLDETKIKNAEDSLKTMLRLDDLKNKRFLDAGCGSGLFSLAALRLGAKEVVSFDIDKDSVACAKYLKKRHGPFPQWHIKSGSALDKDFLTNLGKFDIVYSWGVLHHTGKMWDAINNILLPVDKDGLLFISIYNDQGSITQLWRYIKWFYNISPQIIQLAMSVILYLIIIMINTIKGILHRKHPSSWYDYGSDRGMSLWNDVVDWIGGYPFETATRKELIHFFMKKDFELLNIHKKDGSGCNEFVFRLSR